MGVTVVLLHTLPDGRSHLDWLLQREGEPGLVSFRLWDRPDRGSPWPLVVERAPDHREVYMRFEGELTGGRGRVDRVAMGECVIREEADLVWISARFEGNEQSLVARRLAGVRWLIAPTVTIE